MTYNYSSISEIPEALKEFISDVSGNNINDMFIDEINQFLNDLESWYDMHQMSIHDFLSKE
jgi:hypothetical protein